MTERPFAAFYHRETKHQPHRAARALGYMDWANQPNPFLRFEGATLYPLPLRREDDSPPYAQLYAPGQIAPRPFCAESLGALLAWSMGLAAGKEFQGERWELRCNPSSGNLHPTETYVLAPPTAGLAEEPAVYHYAPREHGLEARHIMSADTWRGIAALHPETLCFVGLTSIHWREAWKYGERAYRYCQLDAGHAIAAVRYAAAALGWRAIALDASGEAELARLLGVAEPRRIDAEPERAETLFAIVPRNHRFPVASGFPYDALEAIAAGPWHGTPKQLSQDHAEWSIIDSVAAACTKPPTPSHLKPPAPHKEDVPPPRRSRPSARTLFYQRRSAQAMDGHTGMPAETFFRMLRRTLPREDAPPFEGGDAFPRIHLALFVHRVEGLVPGLYAFPRGPEGETALRKAMAPRFEWRRPETCPRSLPLYLLLPGDARQAATQVSCGQDIAGDSAFSLGMLAHFAPTLQIDGDWRYPRLFWEAGMVGQVLYLEAEAAGLRGTGIGCFLDDLVHEIFGLRGDTFQSLYHFTAGGPLSDERLRTLPPYPEERYI